MANPSIGFLASRGVRMTPEEFKAEIELALRQHRARLTLQPREELTTDQAAIVEEGGLDLEPRRTGERLQTDRTSADYGALIGSSLTTRQLADLLGRSPSRIRQRIQAGTLYAFQPGSEWLIPRFQLHEETVIQGIEKIVLRLRADLHPLKVERWFLDPNPDLTDPAETRTWAPREWLLDGGDSACVVDLVEHV